MNLSSLGRAPVNTFSTKSLSETVGFYVGLKAVLLFIISEVSKCWTTFLFVSVVQQSLQRSYLVPNSFHSVCTPSFIMQSVTLYYSNITNPFLAQDSSVCGCYKHGNKSMGSVKGRKVLITFSSTTDLREINILPR